MFQWRQLLGRFPVVRRYVEILLCSIVLGDWRDIAALAYCQSFVRFVMASGCVERYNA